MSADDPTAAPVADMAHPMPAFPSSAVQPAWLTAVARALLALVLLVVAVATLLPNWQLAALRRAIPWLSHAISRTERLWLAVDMVHVVMFAAVGLLAALASPAARFGRVLLVVFVLAAATEFVQIWVPGRTSSLFELLLDVTAALVGMSPVFIYRSLLARSSRSRTNEGPEVDP